MTSKKYKSRYGADKDITAAQYLVEFIMERQAKREKTTLPFKFWNIPKWNKIFRMQIKYANELFDCYSAHEVFEALNSKKGKKIYSLGAKKTIIIPLIEEHKRNKQIISTKIEIKNTNDYDNIEIDNKSLAKTKQSSKNLWSKLDGP